MPYRGTKTRELMRAACWGLALLLLAQGSPAVPTSRSPTSAVPQSSPTSSSAEDEEPPVSDPESGCEEIFLPGRGGNSEMEGSDPVSCST